ncbi:LysM peptidoglycan-binding domain-containing protein [Ramlibacter sp. 2FC]|uniref:LysM peptidoglycan-binding domain-containing protein n=1 Tax=Ramlibacter sp. 2FC TaxID=2502188 RepID=UPI0010F56189|nr:LysM peptidoglycan-binding domain-containing protein [Ramlibacter sp. 2FC]
MKHRHPADLYAKAAAAALLSTALAGPPAAAQNYPITPAQRATAQQVAQAGVPLSELAPNAPDQHRVRRGDTLWDISSLFLKSPWRWPELWGMNLDQIRNPHLIYPGQLLVLERQGGRAVLRVAGGNGSGADTVRLSPRTRAEPLGEGALPTLQPHLIEPFLAEPLVVDATQLQQAPRIVATQEHRVLLSRGDRAYVRGDAAAPLIDGQGQPSRFRVFRSATPLKDPESGEILGYEAQYLGQAELRRGESLRQVALADGQTRSDPVPATVDILSAKEEMRTGDRLLPEPSREFRSYAPRAPMAAVEARVVSVYGSAVRYAAQNQVVVINRGTRDGLESGHVLALLRAGERVVDKTDPARTMLQLPDERNGLLMVFRTFERVSYGLVLDIVDSVKVGDRLVNPR